MNPKTKNETSAAPRTDALWREHVLFVNEDEAMEAICDFRELSRELESELAAVKLRCYALELSLCELAVAGELMADECADGRLTDTWDGTRDEINTRLRNK